MRIAEEINFDELMEVTAVETNRIHFDADNSFDLQRFKQSLQYPAFAPAIHANIDGMPFSIGFRQRSPLASIFRGIQNCINRPVIAHARIPALTRQIRDRS
jgi:hypothetical protein